MKTESKTDTATLMRRFSDAFQRHDPTLLNDLVADSCVIENTTPAPDGSRHEGREECLALWSRIATSPGQFQEEAIDVYGDRAIIRWRFRWGEGEQDSVRGVNIMRVREGKIVEAMGYVKGK